MTQADDFLLRNERTPVATVEARVEAPLAPMPRRRTNSWIVYLILGLGSIAFLIPFYFVINGSLKTDAAVQAFHATAVDAGYRDNGGPGERPEYHPGYYAAFVLDPDGNNVEVVNHHRS